MSYRLTKFCRLLCPDSPAFVAEDSDLEATSYEMRWALASFVDRVEPTFQGQVFEAGLYAFLDYVAEHDLCDGNGRVHHGDGPLSGGVWDFCYRAAGLAFHRAFHAGDSLDTPFLNDHRKLMCLTYVLCKCLGEEGPLESRQSLETCIGDHIGRVVSDGYAFLVPDPVYTGLWFQVPALASFVISNSC